MKKYFYTDGKEKFGAFTKEELKSQNLSKDTKIWCYGMDNWTALKNIPELADIINPIPPKPNVTKKKEVKKTESKFGKEKKWIFALLGIILIVLLLSYFGNSKGKYDKKLYNEIVKNSYDADEDFDMYVDKFYRDLGIYGIYPPKPKVKIIKFSKLDESKMTTHIHGMSWGFKNDDKIEIYINPSSWKKFNKPMRYWLMYHELSHDILNVDDLPATKENEGKLMYPKISDYEHKSMDDFIESFKKLFEEHAEK